MKNRMKIRAVMLLCISTFVLALGGCGKKDDESTAIAITPTPAETAAVSETPSGTPEASANSAAGISGNTGGTSTSFSASSNTMVNIGLSANSADGSSKITGTIVAASMEDVTVRTSEGAEYTCVTSSAVNNLTNGITLGNSITVTLASMSAVNGMYTATELNDISSSNAGTAGSQYNSNTYDDGGYTDSLADDGTIYNNSTYDDGAVYDDSAYYDDGTYYDDSAYYDDGSGYYYDPADEIYDDSYGY